MNKDSTPQDEPVNNNFHESRLSIDKQDDESNINFYIR